MEKIGLLGGAFDPIHWGHIQLSKEAYFQRNLDEIQFLPSYEHPFKGQQYLLTYQNRCQLIELSIKYQLTEIKATCNTTEMQLEGTNYTYKTIRWLKKQNPDTHYTFFIGTDNLEQLHLWKNILDLPNICDLVCFARKGFDTQALLQSIAPHFSEQFYTQLKNNIIEVDLPEISSTEIKSAIRENTMTDKMLPTSCIDFINKLSF